MFEVGDVVRTAPVEHPAQMADVVGVGREVLVDLKRPVPHAEKIEVDGSPHVLRILLDPGLGESVPGILAFEVVRRLHHLELVLLLRIDERPARPRAEEPVDGSVVRHVVHAHVGVPDERLVDAVEVVGEVLDDGVRHGLLPVGQ